MTAKLLILGGTTEARQLVGEVAARDIPATLSFAGRVARPAAQPVPTRIGGFGGVEGLAAYLRENAITHLVDATHPFAAAMSANAVAAANATGVKLAALTRPPWTPQPGDRWTRVRDMSEAVDALDRPRRHVMLAVGRMHLEAFARQPQHRYLLRLVDPPEAPPPLPEHEIVVARGPFEADGDRALMRAHGIDVVVAKNAGGTGAAAKLQAARDLGLEVVMIDRPAIPARTELHDVASVMAWMGHDVTDRGV